METGTWTSHAALVKRATTHETTDITKQTENLNEQTKNTMKQNHTKQHKNPNGSGP